MNFDPKPSALWEKGVRGQAVLNRQSNILYRYARRPPEHSAE